MKSENDALHGFIYGMNEDFDAWHDGEDVESPLLLAIMAFKSNLRSALMVGNVPYQMAHQSVVKERFGRLLIAETIRSGQEETTPEVRSKVRTKLANEIADPESFSIFVDKIIGVLDDLLDDGDFASSSRELLRQVLVMVWGAFEILANDLLRSIINERPSLIDAFAEVKQFRDVITSRVLLEALRSQDYNLSKSMGDVFCEQVKLDSLEKIREAVKVAFSDPNVDKLLRDDRLWLIAQQRHLIVHRRGKVDAQFLAKTPGDAKLGDHIIFTNDYVTESIELVRDIGTKLYSAALGVITSLR